MNLYITQQGRLRFQRRPYFALTGWTVRAGYDLPTSSMLQGATIHGLSKDDAIARAKKAMRVIGYDNLYNAA